MQKIFLDSNVYILSELNPSSHEKAILKKLGFFDSQQQSSIQVIISQELIEQILRVGKRLQNKDWGAKIVHKCFSFSYITIHGLYLWIRMLFEDVINVHIGQFIVF